MDTIMNGYEEIETSEVTSNGMFSNLGNNSKPEDEFIF